MNESRPATPAIVLTYAITFVIATLEVKMAADSIFEIYNPSLSLIYITTFFLTLYASWLIVGKLS